MTIRIAKSKNPEEIYNLPEGDIFSQKVLECARKVHSELIGNYAESIFTFPESVFEEAMALMLTDSGFVFERQPRFGTEIEFLGHKIVRELKPDFVIHNRYNNEPRVKNKRYIAIELKACDNLNDLHRQQVKEYLKVTNVSLGLLLNFRCSELDYDFIKLTASNNDLIE